MVIIEKVKEISVYPDVGIIKNGMEINVHAELVVYLCRVPVGHALAMLSEMQIEMDVSAKFLIRYLTQVDSNV